VTSSQLTKTLDVGIANGNQRSSSPSNAIVDATQSVKVFWWPPR